MAARLPKSEPARSLEVARRFWLKIDKRSQNECWPWLAGTDSGDGYGRAYDGYRTRQAHALAWELANGQKIPNGLGALHSCDNPPCCNPAHLRPGTEAENTNDRVIRNRLTVPYRDYEVPQHRRPTGDRNGMRTHPESVLRGEAAVKEKSTKLTKEHVLEIRRAYANGETLTELAKQFGVGAPQIHRIVNRQRWAWLSDEGETKCS